MLGFGLVFVVAGLAFKLGVVPFHMWIPDVYHGAPTPITLMIGGAPEFAAFAITIRLLVEGLSGLAPEWQQMLVVLSIASLVLGIGDVAGKYYVPQFGAFIIYIIMIVVLIWRPQGLFSRAVAK